MRLNRRQFIAGGMAAPMLARTPAKDGAYIGGARQFLDTMIEKGTDRYGRKHTPVFCLSLDPETYSPAKAPDKVDWKYRRNFEWLFRDYGYYWKSHLHSANLIYDQGTMRALYALTEVSGDKRYARAADAYLDFFLENCVSEQTGHFGWGEHVFYNVFTDYIIGGAFGVRSVNKFSYNHEFERWTTIYDLFWPKSPEKTLAEIEAVYDYKIHDPETFINNRHSDYYSGRVTGDTLTFIKHSGLFAHAWTFAHSKTGDPKFQQWARKAADLFWGYRDTRTNLVRGCVQRHDEPVAPEELAQLALFLMRAYQWEPDQLYLDRSLAYLRAYHAHFMVGPGKYRKEVATDGTDKKPGRLAELWEGPLRMAKAAALAYSLSGDATLLEMADDVVSQYTPEMTFSSVVQRSLVSDEIEARNVALGTTIDLYEATGNRKYLDKAQVLATDALRRFLYRGLLVSSMQLHPEGDKSARTKVYDARTGAGWLALNLIRLQRDTDATDAGRFRKFDRLERIYD
ncbi:MAG: hypothetical protein DMG07_11580 [Acidobacteria bacterium]|nr:MAG: hypothetical protein DMG07_11580 [Acidobacteriota bacterium]